MKKWKVYRYRELLIWVVMLVSVVLFGTLLPATAPKTYNTCEECTQAQCQECTDLCGSSE